MENQQEKLKIYEPESRSLIFKIPVGSLNNSLRIVKTDSILDKIINFFRDLLRINKSKFKTIEIFIHTCSPKKIFDYLKLTSEEIDVFPKSLVESQEEPTTYDSVIANSLDMAIGVLIGSDKILEFILGDACKEYFKLIPLFTIEQRRAIHNAFIEVNPVLSDTQKKMGEMMQRLNQMLIEEQEGLSKEIKTVMLSATQENQEGQEEAKL